jgi:broad-specificity NMP kinase
MEIGKRDIEKIRSVWGSLVAITSLVSLLALRTAVLRAEVAGRGWNKEKGQSKNPLVV